MKPTTTVTLLAHLISVAAFAALLSPASAATLTNFDVPGSISTSPVSINQAGAITGPYAAGPGTCDVHGFIRAPSGAISTFDAPVAQGSQVATLPAAINDAGDIAGTYYEAPNCSHPVAHGFLRLASGETTSFDFASCTCFVITGMNNRRTIIGMFIDLINGVLIHGVVRSPHGRLTTFDVPGAIYTRPASINKKGIITGTAEDDQHNVHGFLRSPNGTITQFDVPGAKTYPRSINDRKQITGNAVDSQAGHGFVRAADGTVELFDIAGGSAPEPHAINGRGWITGVYFDTTARRYRGFLRLPNNHTATFDAGAVSTTEGLAINRDGTITGDYYDTSDGLLHGFIRTR